MRRIVLGSLFAALALGVLATPPAALADNHEKGPLLWISYVTAEPGKSQELGVHMATEGKKIYDGLVEDGFALNWGVAQAVNHFPGDNWTHLEWVNFNNWAGVNEFVNRFMAGQQAMGEEARMASAAKWAELTVHGSHFDEISRHGFVAASGERPTYISLSTFETKPGKGAKDVRAIYEKWRAPVMNQLMEDGKILGHGFFTPVVHGPGVDADVTAWHLMTGLDGEDAVDDAAEADQAARSEEQQAEWLADVQAVFSPPGSGHHTDRLLVVLHHSAPPQASASE